MDDTHDRTDTTPQSDGNRSAQNEETDKTTDLRELSDNPSFDIPVRPERRYTRNGGVAYEGGTTFHLVTKPSLSADDLESILTTVLDNDRYVRGDWFDLPRPVFLVHDRTVSTAFRVVVRSGRLELHVLPSTDPAALKAIFDQLRETASVEWNVLYRVESR